MPTSCKRFLPRERVCEKSFAHSRAGTMGRTRPPTASDMRHERHGVVHKGGGVHDGSSHDRHRPGEAEFPAAWCACGRLGGVSQAGVARSGSRGAVVASALRGGDGGVRERAGPGSGVSALERGVRPALPPCVKLFVKRRKTDAAEAKAICEAALRPTMRFVAVKGTERQAHGADGVGGGGEEAVGPRSGGGRPTRRPGPGWRRRRGQAGGTGKGERSSRRGRENRFSSSRLRARGNDSDPIRVPPDRPAANATASRPQPEAGHMTALDRTARTGPKKTLAPTGASTHDDINKHGRMITNLVRYNTLRSITTTTLFRRIRNLKSECDITMIITYRVRGAFFCILLCPR